QEGPRGRDQGLHRHRRPLRATRQPRTHPQDRRQDRGRKRPRMPRVHEGPGARRRPVNERPSARTPAAQRIPRRVMLTVATFCTLGLLLSLLIAAICAVWLPIRGPTRSLYATDPEAPPLLVSLGPLPEHWNAPHSLSVRGRGGITMLGASGTLSPDVSMSGAFLATRIEAGFPARCLVARRLWDSEAGDLSAGPWRSGVVLGPAWRPWTHDPRRYNSILPIRPLAAGLAVNTLAWGAALWLIFRG